MNNIEAKDSYSIFRGLVKYFTEQMIITYGEPDFLKILKILSNVPNGRCGCELYYRTFPDLLKARGVTPEMNYVDEYLAINVEPPLEDGSQAATPQQREVIRKTLRDAGFQIG